MKRVLVTGSAGFIGFHAALKLKEQGNEVLGFDNFNAYYSPALKEARVRLLAQAGVEVIRGDLNDREGLRSLFEKGDFTHVLHLAAQAGVRHARAHPEAYLESNLRGFLELLEVLRLYPHVKLVYASSSSVYGLNEKIPFSVSDPTDMPANLYAATKKANELMAFSYCHLYGLKAAGLRYFTVYGPWGRPDMAYFSFTEAILRGEPIKLFNQGKMARDFTYIDDIVEGTLAALGNEEGHVVYNLGNCAPVDLLTFVGILEKELGKRAQIILEGESQGEVPITYAEIGLAREKLGYAPRTSLEEGLSHFVRWYRQTYKQTV